MLSYSPHTSTTAHLYQYRVLAPHPTISHRYCLPAPKLPLFRSSGRTFPVVDHHLEYLLQRTEYPASSLQLHQVIYCNPMLAGTPSHPAGAMR